jgi:hypothetical protein
MAARRRTSSASGRNRTRPPPSVLRRIRAAGFRSIFSKLPENLRSKIVTFRELCDDALAHSQSENSEKQTYELRLRINPVRSGLCFGWLPAYPIESELASSELLPLRLPAGGSREVRLNLVCKDHSSLSREVNILADLLGFNRGLEEI